MVVFLRVISGKTCWRRRHLPHRSGLRPALIVLFGLTMRVGSPAAQEVRGYVLEGASRNPIPLVEMILLDSTLVMVDRTYSNELGAFVLRAPKPGAYFVLGERLGYRPKVDGILELGAGGMITVDFFLRREPVALDTITVAARRKKVNAFLESVGFYDRLKERSAWFLTPDDLATRVETDATRLFRSAPRVRIIAVPPISTLVFRGGSITTRNSATFGTRSIDPNGYCTPRVLVNGLQVNAAVKGIPGAMIDDVVDVKDIAAIEVHTGPASLPLVYGGTSTTCTTILIWTWAGKSGG